MPVDLNALIEQAAKKYGVPVRIAQNLAMAESSMNPNAVSPAGAIGVMQLMPACVTTDTLCLTRSGWRRYDEISPGDDILTYNIERDCLEWQPVRAVFFYEHPGQLIHMHNQCFDFVVTPNHKWVVEERWKCQRSVVLKETQDLNSTSQNYIVRVAKYPFAKEAAIPDAFVYLLGIVFADGSIGKDGHQVDLYQKDKVDKFRKALNDCGIVYREYLRSQDGVYRWNITGKDALAISQWLWQGGKKRLTMELLTSITEKQALLLWEALLDTDAYTSINGWEGFSQNDLDRATDIQTLLFLMGRLSTVRKVRAPGKAIINGNTVNESAKYQALVKRRKTTSASNNRLRYEVVDEQPVWCPSVDNKTWVALRNGFITITGNTAKALGVDPYDPAQNIEGGIRYLRQQYDRFGSWPLAVAAYNAGPGAVQKYGGIPPHKETQQHVAKVMQGVQGAQQPINALLNATRSWRSSNWPDVLRSMKQFIDAYRSQTPWDKIPAGLKTIQRLAYEEDVRRNKALEDIQRLAYEEDVRRNKALEDIQRQQLDIERTRAEAAMTSAEADVYSALASGARTTEGERIAVSEANALQRVLDKYNELLYKDTMDSFKLAEPGVSKPVLAAMTIQSVVSDPEFVLEATRNQVNLPRLFDTFARTKTGMSLSDLAAQVAAETGENSPLARLTRSYAIAVSGQL